MRLMFLLFLMLLLLQKFVLIQGPRTTRHLLLSRECLTFLVADEGQRKPGKDEEYANENSLIPHVHPLGLVPEVVEIQQLQYIEFHRSDPAR